jgi:hypothetical protein
MEQPIKDGHKLSMNGRTDWKNEATRSTYFTIMRKWKWFSTKGCE